MTMRFVDLFAGLGGFHLALRKLGHECVFACELDETLRTIYEKNFGMKAAGDIRGLYSNSIPKHDVLCAGFPCQPFSKAGSQQGLSYPKSGKLLNDIIRIVKYHKPSYIILEQVPNFAAHNRGQAWNIIGKKLEKLGYDIDHHKLSPHHFGIPQIRERIYIIGSFDPLGDFPWPVPLPDSDKISVKDILMDNPTDARPIPDNVLQCIAVWQEFLDLYPRDNKLPSFPIWSMEFGANYPYEETTPHCLSVEELKKYRGSQGCRLRGSTKEELLKLLPSYARRPDEHFPKWKIDFIRQNRELYQRNKKWIDKWKEKIMNFPSSFQKLEWNCQGEPRKLENFIIQIRASGVRVKRPTTAPSLVAMTATQVPIIAWEKRYMTPAECAKLQSMDELRYLPDQTTKAYEALGNAVNVDVVERVAYALVGLAPTPHKINETSDLLHSPAYSGIQPIAGKYKAPEVAALSE